MRREYIILAILLFLGLTIGSVIMDRHRAEAIPALPDAELQPDSDDRLINGTLSDWASATDQDRISASETMVLRDRKAGITANDLKACIDEVSLGPRLQSQRVAEIAASCMMLMNGGN
ncbi:MAG TPA: hypothetical protein VGH02_09390 [Rhizomicrobium sp.]|jgi:hypothetical protein